MMVIIAYIDFGMMDQLDEVTKKRWWMQLHLVNKDYTDLAEDFVKLGFLTPETDIPDCTCLRSRAEKCN